MRNIEHFPADYLRLRFDYDPLEGVLYWKPQPDAHKGWNGRYAGKPAGHFDRTGHGYINVNLNKVMLKAHIIAFKIYYGRDPNGEHLDHINQIRHDNRICNLREATHQKNLCNHRIFSNNKSGVSGICWDKSRERWIATINGKSLGRFANFDAAFAARKEAEVKLHGEFSPRQ